jgi:hypothetical protein
MTTEDDKQACAGILGFLFAGIFCGGLSLYFWSWMPITIYYGVLMLLFLGAAMFGFGTSKSEEK